MVDYATLVEAADLALLVKHSSVVVADCRYFLDDTEAGRRAYEAGHIPTAVYVHLDEDLCGPPFTDHGRHPLPTEGEMNALFGRLGIAEDTQVVAYDDGGGVAAARLWWMLKFMGHEAAAVLNGGFAGWLTAGYPVESGFRTNEPTLYHGRPRPGMLVRMKDINEGQLLVDSRAAERYRGEIEPIDPVPGHIPGAVNYAHQLNVGDDGRFFSAPLLKERFLHLLGDVPPERAIFYCGSGVTACNNLLALAYSGLGTGRLYVGSWSEWCRDPRNPVEVGE